MALVSVIVPMRDAAPGLSAALDSLLAQSWRRWEAILVDDRASNDNRRIADAYLRSDGRFRCISSPGMTLAEACNHAAFAEARGDLLSFLEPGVAWTPRKLYEVADRVLGSGADGAFGRVGFYRRGNPAPLGHSPLLLGPLTVPALLRENPVLCLSNLSLQREIYRSVGGLCPSHGHAALTDMLIVMAGQGALIEGLPGEHLRQPSPATSVPATRRGRHLRPVRTRPSRSEAGPQPTRLSGPPSIAFPAVKQESADVLRLQRFCRRLPLLLRWLVPCCWRRAGPAD